MLEARARLLKIFADENIKLVCVDADDTLWYDSRYFRKVEQFVVSLCEDDAIQPDELHHLLEKQRRNFNPGERGFAMSVRELVKELKWAPDKIAMIEIELTRFLSHPVELLPGAAETMRLLNSYRRVLLTKGQEAEQQRKIVDSGLDELFDEVMILTKKESRSFQTHLLNLDVPVCRL
jgi:putative hydrolase of the HAD superfamily